eukprot:15449224-Alexandrium_andersonii.AAC.1
MGPSVDESVGGRGGMSDNARGVAGVRGPRQSRRRRIASARLGACAHPRPHPGAAPLTKHNSSPPCRSLCPAPHPPTLLRVAQMANN